MTPNSWILYLQFYHPTRIFHAICIIHVIFLIYLLPAGFRPIHSFKIGVTHLLNALVQTLAIMLKLASFLTDWSRPWLPGPWLMFVEVLTFDCLRLFWKFGFCILLSSKWFYSYFSTNVSIILFSFLFLWEKKGRSCMVIFGHRKELLLLACE